MTRCFIETASDGTKVLVSYAGPTMILGEMGEFNTALAALPPQPLPKPAVAPVATPPNQLTKGE